MSDEVGEMTGDEIKEWDCIYQTRIGCLMPEGEPEPWMRTMARDEADEHILKLRLSS